MNNLKQTGEIDWNSSKKKKVENEKKVRPADVADREARNNFSYASSKVLQ